MDAESALDCRTDYIVLATGSSWTTNGIGRNREMEIEGNTSENVLSADSLFVQTSVMPGHYVIYDDDHYYFSSVLALKLIAAGADVSIVCPEGRICSWGAYTNEQHDNNTQLYRAGVRVVTDRTVDAVDTAGVTTRCIYTGEQELLAADWFVPITCRKPDNGLFESITALMSESNFDEPRPKVYAAGDCESPGTIAAAVYAGYKTALSVVKPDSESAPALRDLPLV